MRRVILESPYTGTPDDIKRNKRYARDALRHCLSLGEAPMASHLLYVQVLKDEKPEKRTLGMEAGLAWAGVAEAAVFYADYGFSMGMLVALQRYGKLGVPVEVRYLGEASAAGGERGRTRPRTGPKSKRG